MRNDYKYIGRQVAKLFPKIAELIMTQKNTGCLLESYQDFPVLVRLFGQYHGISFPHMSSLPDRQATDYRIQFTAFCLLCYDPNNINGVTATKMRPALRRNIASAMRVHPTLVSQYAAKARVYIRAYAEFDQEIMQLVALIKLEKVNNGADVNLTA